MNYFHIFFITFFLGSFYFTLSAKNMIKIGHRGACGYEPENTLCSFLKAIELSCDMIELDVHRCASDQLVVIHDERVDRTTDGTGFVTDKTLAQIKALDAGNGQQIPTLRQVFGVVDRKVNVDIELKGSDTAGPVVNLIEHYVRKKGWTYDDFIVTSFDHCLLKEVFELNSHINVGVLLESMPIDVGLIASNVGARLIVVDHRCLQQKLVDDAHDSGLAVFVYTVNDVCDIDRVTLLGIDGIISDYPDRL